MELYALVFTAAVSLPKVINTEDGSWFAETLENP
jgi:hypothetical protein